MLQRYEDPTCGCYSIDLLFQEGEQDFSSELAALQKEGEMPIEDLLATLPEALLSENAAPLTPSSVEDNDNDDDEGTIFCVVKLCRVVRV